jgi:hypothetical protein
MEPLSKLQEEPRTESPSEWPKPATTASTGSVSEQTPAGEQIFFKKILLL